MQMMCFMCLILLALFFIIAESRVDLRPLEKEFDEDIFYDDTYYLKKIQMKKFQDEIQRKSSKLYQNKKYEITNFNEYIKSNKNNFDNTQNFITVEKGKCQIIFDLEKLYSDFHSNKAILSNIKLLQVFLNEKNYLYNDEFGNLIIYSVCGDLFNLKCNSKFVFVSKLDFEFFEFSQSGDKIPNLEGFSLDFSISKVSNTKILYLFGGIDNKGNHNEDFFKLKIDYTFGVVKIVKLGLNDSQLKPIGVSEGSLNILTYYLENNIESGNDRHLVFTFGGINDQIISNKLWVFNPKQKLWISINSYLTPNVLPARKGHSTVIFESNKFFNANEININKDLVKSYQMIVFGGKNELQYFNDLIIIQINYIILDDTFHYKIRHVGNVIGDIPEGREGHRAIIKDEFMYIFGGCNYQIKKCYNDEIFRLNLMSKPLEWERLTINMREKNFFNSQNLNFQLFRGNFINFGNCNLNFCYNTVTFIANDFSCKCKINIRIIKESKPGEILKCVNDNEYKEEISRLEAKIDNKFSNSTKIDMKESLTQKDGKLSSILIQNITNSSLIKITNMTNLTNKINTQSDYQNTSQIYDELEKIKKALILMFQKTKDNKLINFQESLNFLVNQNRELKIPKLEVRIQNKNPNNTSLFRSNHKEIYPIPIKEKTTTSNKKHHLKQKSKINKTVSNNAYFMHNSLEGNNTVMGYNTHDKININSILKGHKKHINKKQHHQHYEESDHVQEIIEALKLIQYQNFNKYFFSDPNNKEDLSNENINFLSINDRNLSSAIYDNERILEKNLNYTIGISHNVSEIRSYIREENSYLNTEIKKILTNIMNNIKEVNNRTSNKFQDLEKFKNNQEKINDENKIICVNGYLFKKSHCKCFPGYEGVTCETPLVCKNNCHENGVCKYGKCFCNPGFSGNNCEFKNQCLNNCLNRGKCLYGKCFCDPGFLGVDCGVKLNCPNQCNRRGICFSGKCICESGYTGKDCSIIDVNFQPCKNNCNGNGNCKQEKCFCYPGFSGKFCEIRHEFNCPPFINIKDYKLKYNLTSYQNIAWIPCNGNGICKFGMCFCYGGFKGIDCSRVETCKNNCSQNGICLQGRCICNNNSTQDDCSVEINNQIRYFNKMKFKEVTGEIITEENLKMRNVTNSTFKERTVSNDDKIRWIYNGVIILMLTLIIILTMLLNRKEFFTD